MCLGRQGYLAHAGLRHRGLGDRAPKGPPPVQLLKSEGVPPLTTLLAPSASLMNINDNIEHARVAIEDGWYDLNLVTELPPTSWPGVETMVPFVLAT